MNASELSRDEIAHLLRLLDLGRTYYRTLVASPHCTPQNRHLYQLIEGLGRKLETAKSPTK